MAAGERVNTSFLILINKTSRVNVYLSGEVTMKLNSSAGSLYPLRKVLRALPYRRKRPNNVDLVFRDSLENGKNIYFWAREDARDSFPFS